MTNFDFTANELLGIRAAQERTFDCLREVAAELYAGISERSVAARIEERLAARAADGWFHRPLVLFGERTTLGAGAAGGNFEPGWCVLERGQPWILDVAPLYEGLPADLCLCGSLGDNPLVEEGQTLLKELLGVFPQLVNRSRTAAEIVRGVDAWTAERRWSSLHSAYLGGALAHRLARCPWAPLGRGHRRGLGLAADLDLLRARWWGERQVYWSDGPHSESPPAAGLWSVDLHLARGGVGVKTEGLLWLDGHGARWLDESPLPLA